MFATKNLASSHTCNQQLYSSQALSNAMPDRFIWTAFMLRLCAADDDTQLSVYNVSMPLNDLLRADVSLRNCTRSLTAMVVMGQKVHMQSRSKFTSLYAMVVRPSQTNSSRTRNTLYPTAWRPHDVCWQTFLFCPCPLFCYSFCNNSNNAATTQQNYEYQRFGPGCSGGSRGM